MRKLLPSLALLLLPIPRPLGSADEEAPGTAPAAPVVKVREARGAVQVDGRLDEEAWRDAAAVSLRRADGKADASQPTLVKLVHDRKSLFIAFTCLDPDIWTAHRGRDSHMWTEDVVEVFIDVAPADEGYVELEVNPLGDLFDGIFLRHRRDVLMSWNPAIRVAVAAEGTVNQREDRDRSWTVEMSIPAAELAPSPGVGRPGAEIRAGAAWRINFYRNERSGTEGELQAWAPVRGDFHAPALFGRLEFE